MRRFVIATVLATVSTAAFAQAPCSLDGVANWPHPADLEALSRSDWPNPQGGETCREAISTVSVAGGKSYRFSFATISRSGSTDRIGAILTISRMDEGKEVRLGSFVIPLGLIESNPDGPSVQLREQDGKLFASLTRKEAELFAIGADGVERLPNAEWYGEIIRSLTPKDEVGQILRFDLEASTAFVGLHQAHASDPAKPASALAPPRVLQVDLAWREGKLAVASKREVELRHVPGVEIDEDEADHKAKIRKRIGALPAGTEMCWLSAYSVDKDPKGLNVRSEPSANASIRGQLAPPMKDPELGETLAKEVTIVGYRDGWFLIDTKIDEEEPGPGASAKKARKRWFEGRGWVNARMLGASTAYSGLGEHKLFNAPTPLAHFSIGRQKDGSPMNGDSAVARIHACSFDWALVDSEGGQRGWRRRLCSNQLTTCP